MSHEGDERNLLEIHALAAKVGALNAPRRSAYARERANKATYRDDDETALVETEDRLVFVRVVLDKPPPADLRALAVET